MNAHSHHQTSARTTPIGYQIRLHVATRFILHSRFIASAAQSNASARYYQGHLKEYSLSEWTWIIATVSLGKLPLLELICSYEALREFLSIQPLPRGPDPTCPLARQYDWRIRSYLLRERQFDPAKSMTRSSSG